MFCFRRSLFAVLFFIFLLEISASYGARRSHRKHRSGQSYEILEVNHLEQDFLKRHVRRQADSRQSPRDIASPDARAAPINTRPSFTKCGDASIPEGESAGTFVTKVEATDPDPGPAGKLHYEIIRSQSVEKQFNVDKFTGEITTAKVFDRDEPKREKLFYVTVKAVDDGSPAMDVLCTFSVTITDKNDNAPIFDQNDYRETIPQDSRMNHTVMRVAATDIDEGDDVKITYSLRANKVESDLEYFSIDPQSGFIRLAKIIEPEKVNYDFELVATARNGRTSSEEATALLNVRVGTSNKRAPKFVDVPIGVIDVEESLSDFSQPIANLRAESNVEEPLVFFSLVNGQTEDTNKKETFRIVERANGSVEVILARKLDYEAVSNYQLKIRVQNIYDVSVESIVRLRVIDSNDEIPSFNAVEPGRVLENSAVGTCVLRVSAIDNDGTSPNNKVSYSLLSNTDTFSIDSEGEIRTLKQLDREEATYYLVTVQVEDGAPSSLRYDGLPNKFIKTFRVEVLNQNDNPPRFGQQAYIAKIFEDSEKNFRVIGVTAHDKDEFAVIHYEITHGNVGNAFRISEISGVIRVNNLLDYETIREYNLRVRAHDGIHYDEAIVNVQILNVNDNPPVFENTNTLIIKNIVKRAPKRDPIAKITATDPDWDRGGSNPYIKFFLDQTGQYAKHFEIMTSGELFLIKRFDRDQPNGYPEPCVTIIAEDRLEPNGKVQLQALVLELHLDDSDNTPFLSVEQPVVFNENQKPMLVTNLTVEDYDAETEGNGAPFQMKIDPRSEQVITKSFTVFKEPSGVWQLHSNVIFDREERKSYNIPIVMIGGDPSLRQTGTSTLEVIIGDENDNDMKDGKSSILVYNYKNSLPDTVIGRAYVDDPDDWDLSDKEFTWFDTVSPHYFSLSPKGNITMKAGTPPGEYILRVKAYDQKWKSTAIAVVTVTSVEITEEAVKKSGSVRIGGSNEIDFITPNSKDPNSKNDILRHSLAEYLRVPVENVDLFTVRGVDSDKRLVDARFSVHNSTYWDPVKIKGLLGGNAAELQLVSGIEVVGIGIDECIKDPGPCDGPCSSFLMILDDPYIVYGNTASFVGVNAFTKYTCAYRIGPIVHAPRRYLKDPCDGYCYNGGTCHATGIRMRCVCPENFEGPRCEALEASFNGDSFGFLPPLPACSAGSITFEFTSHTDNGLMFYNGPHSVPHDKSITDFVAVELDDGVPVAYLNLGSGVRKLQLNDSKNYGDKEIHVLELRWNHKQEVRLTLDGCLSTNCSVVDTMPGKSTLLNVNGPIQLGHAVTRLDLIGIELQWASIPENGYFVGCISNLRFNNYTFDMASMSYSKNVLLSRKDISVALVLSQTVIIVTAVSGTLLLLILLYCSRYAASRHLTPSSTMLTPNLSLLLLGTQHRKPLPLVL